MKEQYFCIQCKKDFSSKTDKKPNCPFCDRRFSVFLKSELEKEHKSIVASKNGESFNKFPEDEPKEINNSEENIEINEDYGSLYSLAIHDISSIQSLPLNGDYFNYFIIAYIGIVIGFVPLFFFGLPEKFKIPLLVLGIGAIIAPFLMFFVFKIFDRLMVRLNNESNFERLFKANMLIAGTYQAFLVLLQNLFTNLGISEINIIISIINGLIFLLIIKTVYRISFLKALKDTILIQVGVCILSLIIVIVFMLGIAIITKIFL